jgi:hypothetical protein
LDPNQSHPAEPSPYATPGADFEASPAPGGAWKKIMLWGCLGIFTLVALPIAGCAAFLMKRGSELTPACEAYLASTQAGNYREAYDQVAPGFREAVPNFEDYSRFERVIRARMGRLHSKTRTGVQVFPSEAHLTYNAVFEKGPGTIAFKLLKVDGNWKVLAVNYNSALLTVPLHCPACGSRNPLHARHCSACGAALEAAKDPQR